MQSVTLGITPSFPDNLFTSQDVVTANAASMAGSSPTGGTGPFNNNMMGNVDPSQLQHLAHLLNAAQGSASTAAAAKQTAVVECPKSMVGRVIGKGGETIKSLQQYTGAMIQIDQSTDPTRVTIAGSPQSLQLAVSMVNDIVRGTFKGFAMLRQIAMAANPAAGPYAQPQPVYVQGYGFVPPSQVFAPEESLGSSLVRAAPPTGPITPPITPLRASDSAAANNVVGGFPDVGLAALLGAQQSQQQQAQSYQPQQHAFGGAAAAAQQQPSQDAIIAALLSQLAVQQQPMANMQQPSSLPMQGMGFGAQQAQALPQATIQSLLSQSLNTGAASSSFPSAPAAPMHQGLGGQGAASSGAGLPIASSSPLGSVSAPFSPTHLVPAGSPSSQGGSSGRASPASQTNIGLQAAVNQNLTRSRDSGSRDSSPLGRYGAIGSGAPSKAAGTQDVLQPSPGAGPDFGHTFWRQQ
jgi:predicted RNA-binding protein YlqC (UPF0109 family)